MGKDVSLQNAGPLTRLFLVCKTDIFSCIYLMSRSSSEFLYLVVVTFFLWLRLYLESFTIRMLSMNATNMAAAVELCWQGFVPASSFPTQHSSKDITKFALADIVNASVFITKSHFT